MKLYWLPVVFAASIIQKSPLLVGALWNPAHGTVASLSFRNLSSVSATPGEVFYNLNVGISSQTGSASTAQTEAGALAKVQGTVKDVTPRREPVPYAIVKLFPDPFDLQRTDLIRSTKTDERGYFVFENVVPGKYRAIAFIGANPEDLETEATIAAHAGAQINLSEKESKTLTIYLYPAH